MFGKIISAIDSPRDLESLYQQDSEDFQRTFPDVFAHYPDSVILQVWNERLKYITSMIAQRTGEAWSSRNILFIVVLSLIAGTIVELPQYFPKIDGSWFYTRMVIETVVLALIFYFLFQPVHSKWTTIFVLALAAGAILYLNVLPSEYAPAAYGPSSYLFEQKYRSFYDALTLAELYIPIVLWMLVGVAFLGKNWREISGRMNFIRYNGELLIYTTILLIGEATLAGITLALLNAVKVPYQWTDWYSKYIVVYAAVAAPIASTFLITRVINKRFNMAPLLARIFTPLFLITSIAFLVIVIIRNKDLSGNRDTLIAFNVLLIFVLGLSVFAIAERNPAISRGVSDYMNIGLVLTTIVIDLIAVSATVIRMTSLGYGLTPNRIAVLGINLLFFCHLVGILIYYTRFIFRKASFDGLEKWITAYLPAYGIWAVIISIALPLIFWYK